MPDLQTQNPQNSSMIEPHQITRDDETLDDLLHGSLKIIQKKDGYRFSVDAILLANFIGVPKAESIIDLGTGCGIIPILLAHMTKVNKIVGVEVQEDLAEMARRSVELNDLCRRITIFHKDLNNLKELFETESFDMVVSNPPYRKAYSGRINPHSQKAIARHEIKCSLQDVLKVSRHLVKPMGKVYIVFPVVRLGDIISQHREVGLEPKKLQIVYSNINSEGKLVLIEASKGGRSGLKVLKPLFTHDKDGNPNLLETSEA